MDWSGLDRDIRRERVKPNVPFIRPPKKTFSTGIEMEWVKDFFSKCENKQFT